MGFKYNVVRSKYDGTARCCAQLYNMSMNLARSNFKLGVSFSAMTSLSLITDSNIRHYVLVIFIYY